ncbi:MAG: AAA family ATPase [Actinobacteria bacterium]|nr:AAA family ATPase [Actinomycetota bacterium]
MKVTALRARGYRNLDGIYALPAPLAVLVGENNAGKSNLVDALRTVLEPENEPGFGGRLWPEDFAHDGRGAALASELELEVRLADLTEAEQARMVTCLAPSLGPACARLRLHARLRPDNRVVVQWFGGDSAHPEVERHAREGIRFAYLHPLRDAAADLRPGRQNRLVQLLAALAPDGHPDRDRIVAEAENANDAMGKIPTVEAAKDKIARRLLAMTGSGRFRQQTDLAFADPRFERVVGALRARIGQFAALEMAENGLGFNNLLYMAVLLAAITDAPDDGALRVLLVEEPEAHLHPQLQDLLMRFLEDQAGGPTQVVVTSHSPNFASSARIDRLVVLARAPGALNPVARAPREFGLSGKQLNHLRRFLDVTKSSLFFARAVILVEGVSEQLLLPPIASRLGVSLVENGVSVIDIGGVAFPPFTDLFGPEKLPYRLAVISDADGQPSADDLVGAEESLSPRADALAARAGDNIRVRLAPNTLEWALVAAGNVEIALDALAAVKPRVADRLRGEVNLLEPEAAAGPILEAISDVKGRFAQELAELLADQDREFAVPDFLRESIEWVTEARHDGADEPPAEQE